MTGRIDPVLVDFVTTSVAKAERGGAELLLVRLNSPGSVVSDDELTRVAARLHGASVPVAVWVGPSGAKARDGAVELVRAADISGIAQGARIGDERSLSATEAKQARLVDVIAPTLGEFLVSLDGRTIGGTKIDVASVERTSAGPRLQPNVEVRFAKPSLVPRLFHTVASPAVAYLLLVIGLLLLVFEFFTAGVGIAGACGAVALLLSSYGIGVLPARGWAVALVVLGVAGYAVDVQTGVPRAWTVIGSVAFAFGSLFFYGDGLSPGVLPLVVAFVGMPLFMVAGMASMVRARFSTPTIGRESMVGEEGTAVGAINPDGMVRVRGGLWRARTNRATPIPGGDTVRVAAIDGLLLEVEPLEGAARDAGH